MNSLKNLLVFYAVLFIFALFIQSCCTSSYKIIGVGDLSIIGATTGEIDTIRNEFTFVINPELELMSNVNNINLMASSYALSCDINISNSIDLSTVKIFCDKNFVFDNETVTPNTDFVNFDGIILDSTVSLDIVTVSIGVSQLFIDAALFENEAHQFTIEMETDDGVTLRDSISLFIEL